MLMRVGTAEGMTLSRYSADWTANHSRHGALTTRVGIPSASNALCAATASDTSEPVAMRIAWGFLLASFSM